jgi:hypothetical protein
MLPISRRVGKTTDLTALQNKKIVFCVLLPGNLPFPGFFLQKLRRDLFSETHNILYVSAKKTTKYENLLLNLSFISNFLKSIIIKMSGSVFFCLQFDFLSLYLRYIRQEIMAAQRKNIMENVLRANN